MVDHVRAFKRALINTLHFIVLALEKDNNLVKDNVSFLWIDAWGKQQHLSYNVMICPGALFSIGLGGLKPYQY